MNRLPSLERGKRPLINEVQADLHPWEVLYDVKKLLTVGFVSLSSMRIWALLKGRLPIATTPLRVIRAHDSGLSFVRCLVRYAKSDDYGGRTVGCTRRSKRCVEHDGFV